MLEKFYTNEKKLKAEADRLNEITQKAEKKALNKLMQMNNQRLWQAGFVLPGNQRHNFLYSPNQELHAQLKNLRADSRYLFQNTPAVASAVAKIQQNIKPFKLASKVTNKKNGLNSKINTQIEDAWNDFCKMGNFEVSGRYSLNDCIDQMVIQKVIDGEILLRKVRGRGKYGYQIQLINTDQLHIETHNTISGPYSMGIEHDEWGTPMTFYINTKMPTEGGTVIPVPAKDIIHAFKPNGITAFRGVPLIAPVMTKIELLDDYAMAVITAAKNAACTAVTYEQKAYNIDGEPYDGSEQAIPVGNCENIMVQGIVAESLPYGVEKKLLTPNYPTQSYPEAVKVEKKDIATGIGLSYNTLYSDIEDPSFSGMKAAFIQDKNFFEEEQRFFIEKVLDVIFDDFIDTACSLGKLKLPAGPGGSWDIYKEHSFIGNGFAFLDRIKDTQADIADIDAGLANISEILALRGKDFEDFCQTKQRDLQTMARYGLVLTDVAPTNNPAMGKPTSEPNSEELVDEGTAAPEDSKPSVKMVDDDDELIFISL